MSNHNGKSVISRRKFLQTGAALGAGLAVSSSVGFPTILKAANEPIKLGIMLPFSGGMELFGQQGLQGCQMLVEEVNAAGGILGGRKLELVIADNKSDPKVAVERTVQLIQRDKVSAVIGPIASALRDAVKPTVERLKTPLLYATDYEGGVCSPWVACYSPLPEHYVQPLVPYMVENFGKKIYLFGADYSWPQKMNVAIKDTVAKHGGEIVAEEYTPFGAKDFSAVLTKIKDTGADITLLTLPGADGVTFIKQYSAAGLKESCKLGFFGFNDNYLPGLTSEESNGVMAIVHFSRVLDRPETKDFVARQQKMFGDNATISYYAESHYGITKFFVEAIKKAGSDDKTQIMANLPGTEVIGNGDVHLRADDRHVDLNMLIVEAKDSQLTQIKYVGKIVAPSQCG
ncbi:MAG: ABC transporter substrate-binding protein [Deltaproteobacteria bacterium]|jgi:branched-chain amino acid transport system substrate-binding protein/urea transport system substrate-binding protein|nr:ABC transporter substrate-binding protein [Deltaproteobacteria bacterium]